VTNRDEIIYLFHIDSDEPYRMLFRVGANIPAVAGQLAFAPFFGYQWQSVVLARF
jgi:hypothetical protein